MRIPIAVVTALAGLAAADLEVAPGDASIRYLGRWAADRSGDVHWSWSASGAAITFQGSSCSIHLQAKGALYDILVDGRKTGVLDLSASDDTLFRLATGLARGNHTVGVRLRTEANFSEARFRGFRIDGTPLEAQAGSGRRVEFYGNSITCGYGIRDSLKEHTFDIRTEDESLTYAALASDSLGAERHTVCWSGRGVIQNYGGDTSSPTLPRLFRRVLPSDATDLWDFSGWIPQVVVIDLGTNDYSTTPPDSAKFRRTYSAFVDSLHSLYPQARFVLVDGPMLSPGSDGFNRLRRNLDDVAALASARGVDVSHLSLSPQDGSLGYGADWHPSRAQAALNGRELATYLKDAMGWNEASRAAPRPATRSPVRLVRTANGLFARIPAGPGALVRIVDVRGSGIWGGFAEGGSDCPLPLLRRARWLVVEAGGGREVLPLQPDLR